jgi:hypothetical protein
MTHLKIKYVTLEAMVTVNMKIVILWNVRPPYLSDRYKCFCGKFCLDLKIELNQLEKGACYVEEGETDYCVRKWT